MEGLGNERFVDPFDLPGRRREDMRPNEIMEVIEITPDRIICNLVIQLGSNLKVGIKRASLDTTALKKELQVGVRFLWDRDTNKAFPAPPEVSTGEIVRKLAESFEKTREELLRLREEEGFTTDNE